MFLSMFRENEFLNKFLNLGRRVIPQGVFRWAQPIYHWKLAMLGAIIYGFPSRAMMVIAVTGTKGKSTTVYMISKIFEEQGLPVAAVGSLGFKIKERIWPNTLKMTLPGRMKLQKFLYRAKKAGVRYVVLEATSEGIVQNRLAGVKIDCAVYINLHREHLESHGSFENYMAAKQKLFLKVRGIHVLNIDDPYFEKFANFPAKQKITYGKSGGTITQLQPPIPRLRLQLLGDFNTFNALAALAVAKAYNLDMEKAVTSLNSIKSVSGRMEIIHAPRGFNVVVDYAHTRDSLELVYKTLKSQLQSEEVEPLNKLICVLGAAGGGRDRWKRPEFGKIAAGYCDEVILTNEDPYDENPLAIIEEIEKGFSSISNFSRTIALGELRGKQFPISNEKRRQPNYQKILDRKEAIRTALSSAKSGDIVIITGKGSETSMAVAGGKKITWSDKGIVEKLLKVD